jgi:protein phosphatase
MGGHTNGQLASQMAVDSIVETTKSQEAIDSPLEQLVLGLQAANKNVYRHAADNPDCHGMGTTAVGVRIADTRMQICHVGDSRLYRLRGPGLQLLTRDHSLTNLYADKPELEGRMGPATSNVIVRAIGLEPNVAVEHREVAIEEDDLFLLCCDGLNDLVDDATIAEILLSDAPLPVMATRLVETANKNGGTDNITVILVSILSKETAFADEGKTTHGF